MSYLIISFSHKNIDIKMREKLAFGSVEDKDRFIRVILENEHTKEVVLLSTWNRVEIITRSTNIKVSAKNIIEKLASYSVVEFDILYEKFRSVSIALASPELDIIRYSKASSWIFISLSFK